MSKVPTLGKLTSRKGHILANQLLVAVISHGKKDFTFKRSTGKSTPLERSCKRSWCPGFA